MAAKKKTETAIEETIEAAEETAAETTAAAVEKTVETAAEEGTDLAAVKAKVVTRFRDKYTNKLYKPGDIIEVTEERLAEMNTGKERVQLQEE